MDVFDLILFRIMLKQCLHNIAAHIFNTTFLFPPIQTVSTKEKTSKYG